MLSVLIATGSLVADPATVNTINTPAVSGSVASAAGKAVVPGAKLAGPSAMSTLDSLPVKGKAAATGYDRNAKFGNGWKDSDGNKCDERQDTLKRDMFKVKYKDSRNCQLASGTLKDAYTGTTINWKVNSGSVDIDHVVALKNVWISGGQKLSQEQRVAVANDPLNLMASQASANRSKGDDNAAEWLPTNKAFRCQYVATQIGVKKKYALSVTAAEKDAMKRVLQACPTQKTAAVTPIKLSGKNPSVAPSTSKAAPAKAPSTNTAKAKQVSPGAYCAKADAGLKGVGKTNGKTYTCKTSSTDARLRWR
ncbi:HNH endonuclease family protein [Paeniglutamicibacter sp. NPDC012692]|uniref:HNH endonuclease family protein n=1 Tax=Paeniglutamicibacter sp. NPDC012692 TaxID=3364388 RepID=UPI003692522B